MTVKYPQGEDVPELPAGRPALGVDRALRGLRGELRRRHAAATSSRRPPARTASSSTASAARAARGVRTTSSRTRSRCSRGAGSPSSDVRVDPGGRISFKRRAAAHDRREQRRAAGDRREIGPIDYPDSYSSPARFIKNERTAFRDPAAPADPQEVRVVLLHLHVPAVGRHGRRRGRVPDDRRPRRPSLPVQGAPPRRPLVGDAQAPPARGRLRAERATCATTTATTTGPTPRRLYGSAG